MNEAIRVIAINDGTGRVIAPDWLARAERVHRQLRPQIAPDYAGTMQRVFSGGARQCVAVIGENVVGIAVYRIHENTVDGVQMYVDDLVTDDAKRSQGIGKALMEHLQQVARESGCANFNLDSGTQRQQAHKFYFREGLVVTSFHFAKPLTDSTR
jgi:GNAT superfamily N-acetyltransferase